MQIHDIQRTHANKREKRVGRGGRRGKTSGRGHKGQKARAGHSIRPEARDIIKRLPKLRGESAAGSLNRYRPQPVEINVGRIAEMFAAGETVSPAQLAEKGVDVRRGGKLRRVKILGTGDITIALTVDGCDISGAAKNKIENAGGTVVTAH